MSYGGSSLGQNLSIEGCESALRTCVDPSPCPLPKPKERESVSRLLESSEVTNFVGPVGNSVVVLTFLLPSWRRLLEPKRSFNSTTRRRAFLPLLGLRAEALAKAWERAG